MKKLVNKKELKKDNFSKNILSGAALIILSAILLNLAFIVYALFHTIFSGIISIFVNLDYEYNSELFWFPLLNHLLSLVCFAIISYFILKSKLADFYKAAYSTVVFALIFVTIGIFLNNFPILIYYLCSLIGIGIIYYLYKTKKSWLYYLALIFISLALIIMGLTGQDI